MRRLNGELKVFKRELILYVFDLKGINFLEHKSLSIFSKYREET